MTQYLTKQELFDNVAIHLLTQRVKSSESGGCKYRMITQETTLKCAIGALISDDEYKSEFDLSSDTSIGKLENIHIRKAAGISEADIELAAALQTLHDNGDNGDGDNFVQWSKELLLLGLSYGLSTEVLQKIGS